MFVFLDECRISAASMQIDCAEYYRNDKEEKNAAVKKAIKNWAQHEKKNEAHVHQNCLATSTNINGSSYRILNAYVHIVWVKRPRALTCA